ncbi:putative Kunitz domain-containing protein [Ixodes scapularis]
MKLLKLILLVCCCSIAMTKRHFCTLPPESGHCRAYVPSWYYDPFTHSCKVFVYGGCGGNGNRFYTMQQCQEVCWHRNIYNSGSCTAPPEKGSCTADVKKWYFQPTTGTCRTFIYGGCGGNANNYRNREECQLTCIHKGRLPMPINKLIATK